MHHNTRQLKLYKSKKSKTKKKHFAPLLICGAIVLGGTMSLICNFDESGGCEESGCTQKPIELNFVASAEKLANKESAKKNSTVTRTERLSALQLPDINKENSRLLMQRDIQREIINNLSHLPFNYDENDLCILEVKKDSDDLKVLECTNKVTKRFVQLSLSKFNFKQIVKRYNREEFTPQLEVRLTK